MSSRKGGVAKSNRRVVAKAPGPILWEQLRPFALLRSYAACVFMFSTTLWRGRVYIRQIGLGLFVLSVLLAAFSVLDPVFECWSVGRLGASEDLTVWHGGAFQRLGCI